MSLSFNEVHGVILWGSESSALSVAFQSAKSTMPGKSFQVPCPDVETGPGEGISRNTCTHRHDLDEDGGEVVEVRVAGNLETLALRMALWTASGSVRDIFGCPVDAMGGYFARVCVLQVRFTTYYSLDAF